MGGEAEIDRALAAITAAVNDPQLDDFDAELVQALVDSALGGELRWAVDDGGGLHDESGRRVGAIRRTPSGEWITDRQNPGAERSDAPIPAHQRKD